MAHRRSRERLWHALGIYALVTTGLFAIAWNTLR